MVFKVKDHYFKKAKKENFLARSIYKLEEIDKKYQVLKKGDRVVDFGYYPGSWTQYTSHKVGPEGRVVGLDIQGVNKKLCHQKNISLFELDIFDLYDLKTLNEDQPFDVVLSDMAPSTTGIRSVDQDRSANLVEKVFQIVPLYLKLGGNVVVKVFEGHDVQVFLKEQSKRFNQFHYLRPKATRSISKEFFVIAKGYIG